MSRIGKKPIVIPEKVKVTIAGRKVQVEGPKGKSEFEFHPRMSCEVKEGQVLVARPTDNKLDRSLHGLTRSLIQNMVTGTVEGFEKTLEIQGVGFKAEGKGPSVKLSLGFSHPIEYAIPAGVKVETPSPTVVKVSGVDKQAVGQVAAELRGFFEAEPYKGKGIRYAGEQVRRKQGKSVGK
jgi:large subunit ribosomal protein L6